MKTAATIDFCLDWWNFSANFETSLTGGSQSVCLSVDVS